MNIITPQFLIANFFNITGLNKANILELKTIMGQLVYVASQNNFQLDWSSTNFDLMQDKYSDLFYISDLVFDYLTMKETETIIKTTEKFRSWNKVDRNNFISDEFNFNIPKAIIDETFKLINQYYDEKYLNLKRSTKKIKPCDCKDIIATKLLQEQGICINNNSITVSPNNVILEIGHTSIKIPMSIFKTFSEWYLTEQNVS
jgi:hypothetical protein